MALGFVGVLAICEEEGVEDEGTSVGDDEGLVFGEVEVLGTQIFLVSTFSNSLSFSISSFEKKYCASLWCISCVPKSSHPLRASVSRLLRT